MTGGFQHIDGMGNMSHRRHGDMSVVNGMAHIDLVVVAPPKASSRRCGPSSIS
jgi:hypothetical protein